MKCIRVSNNMLLCWLLMDCMHKLIIIDYTRKDEQWPDSQNELPKHNPLKITLGREFNNVLL